MEYNYNNSLSEEDDGLCRHVISFFRNNTYFIACLGLIILASFILVSRVQDTRKNTTKMNQELKLQDKIVQEYQHLRLERQTLTEYSHVKALAKEKLHMSDPTVENKKVIDVRNSGGNFK